MISQGNAENTAVRDIFEEDMQVLHFYGEDPQGSPPNEFDLGSVELVPDTIPPINGSQLEAISYTQPLSESNDYGGSLYLETRQIIQALIQAQNHSKGAKAQLHLTWRDVNVHVTNNRHKYWSVSFITLKLLMI